MNIKLNLNNETISEGSDDYGAGGAFPTRGEAWVKSQVERDVAMLIVPDADDSDSALERAGKIEVNVTTPGQWPEVEVWSGTVTSARGIEQFELVTH